MGAKRMQHVPPKNVVICCTDMLRSFGQGFIHDKLRHNIVKLKTSQSVREKLGSYCKKSIFLWFALTFKFGNAKTGQSLLVYCLTDKNNQQKQFLWEKFQEARNKQKKWNMSLWVRSVAAKMLLSWLILIGSWLILIGLSQFVVSWLVLKRYVFVDNAFAS